MAPTAQISAVERQPISITNQNGINTDLKWIFFVPGEHQGQALYFH